MVVSLHDICPLHERQFDRWRLLLDKWGIPRRSLAVVPRWEGCGRSSASSSLRRAVAEELRGGSEVVLHGYTHRHQGPYHRLAHRLRDRLLTRGCAEFSDLDEQAAGDLLARGIAELGELSGQPVRGFTAPGWWQSRAVGRALARLGFRFWTSVGGVTDLAAGRTLRSPVITGLPGRERSFIFLLERYHLGLLPPLLRHRHLVRVALHPYDLEHPRYMDRVGRLLRELAHRRRVVVYEEALA